MDLIASLIGTAGVSGALCWYLYHTTAITIPKLTETHSDTLKSISNTFSDTLREEREYRKEEFHELKEFIKTEACKHKCSTQPN